MALRLDGEWAWDFCLADDGADHHLFVLVAPRTLGDPHDRHRHARIAHAVSRDLRTWTRLPDALGPGPGEPVARGFDDVATETGSVLRDPLGRWLMFYTGVTEGSGGRLDRAVGLAVSDDLLTWRRYAHNPVSRADPRWYEVAGDPGCAGEQWGDPWVVADPGGDGWHMLTTARHRRGPADDRGVVGHARSADLITWIPQPPLTARGGGFGRLDVPQLASVGGQHLLVFSCLRNRFSRARRAHAGGGGVWMASGPEPLGPFDVRGARPLTNNALYGGRLVLDREGRWQLLAFRTFDGRGLFLGEITDPMPLVADGHGGVVALGGFADHTYKAAEA